MKCVRDCEFSGVKFRSGDTKKFYSALKAKHFIERAPTGAFINAGNSG